VDEFKFRKKVSYGFIFYESELADAKFLKRVRKSLLNSKPKKWSDCVKLISEVIKAEEYKFIDTNEHISGNLIFLTYGGSHAYGTATQNSDIDIRGCAFNRKSDLLGLSNFEQLVEETTDTTVYSFNKLISLLLNVNPYDGQRNSDRKKGG